MHDCVREQLDYTSLSAVSCYTESLHVSVPQFMEKMMAEYGEQAKEAGIYIVPSCGFDCIPNDLGTLMLQRTFNGDLAYVESYMCAHHAVLSSSIALYCC